MPGVVVTTAVRSGPSAPLRSTSGQFFVVGLAERGPADKATLIKGMADFEQIFGPRVSYGYLHDVLKTYFEEGGAQAYIARVVGPASTKGTITLNDRAGTPLPTLRVDAASPGDWSSRLKVVVAAGSLAATFKMTVQLDNIPVEVQDNISTPVEAVTRFSTSVYIRLVDQGSVTAAPNNQPATGTFTVSAGTDDRASVNAASYTTALTLFTEGFGDGAVAIPGQGTAVHAGIDTHCKANNRIGLLSHTVTASVSDLTTAAGALNSQSVGLFAPWVLVTDGAGGSRQSPPEGYVAGVRARAHNDVGPWRTPAGGAAVARNVIGVNVEYTRQEGDALDAARVSHIRRVAGSIRLYGWRSLSGDEQNFALLSIQDLLNFLVVEGAKRLEQYVFAPVDGKNQLLSAINAELVGLVEPIRTAGGVYEKVDEEGNLLDPGYLVETGPSVNSLATLSQNRVKARLSVRPSPTAALIELTIVRVGLLAGL